MPASQPRPGALQLGFIIAVGPVSVDMYLPAFGAIAHRFGTAVPQWTLAAYFLGFAAGQLAQGLLADRYGRRLPLACGLALYTVASLGCAGATDAAWLCLCRAVAAFGAAACIVVPRAIVRDLADGRSAAGLMSTVMQVMSVAPVLAPVLGSLILLGGSWRLIFVAAALYGLAGLYLLARSIPETLPPERRVPRGAGEIFGLYGALLREKIFLTHAWIGAMGMAALFAYRAGAPGIFLGQAHFGPFAFGLVLAGLGGALVLCFRLNGVLVARHGERWAIGFGILVWLGASLAMLGITEAPWLGAAAWVLALLVFGLGYSCIPGNAQVAALGPHRNHAATATGLMSTLQYCAGAAAGALVGAFAGEIGGPMACIMFGCALAAGTAALLLPALQARNAPP
jgi:MFS transporter, DHA1 family, multidrug resistance protein